MPRPQRKRPPGRPGRFSKCRLLLVIDNEPIRQRAWKDYQAAEQNLLRLREEIEAFETRDLPAYHRWEASVFGPLLTEIREMETAAAEKRRLLAEIEDEALWTNCSMAAAYRKVMRRLSRPETSFSDHEDEEDPFSTHGSREDEKDGERMFGDSDLPPGFDFAQYDALSTAQKKKFHASYANIAAMFEAVTGNPAPRLEDVLRRERGENADHASHFQAPPPEQTSEEQRLKTLYRRLARELHPDANPGQGTRERELWHDVQAAFLARDLERLEAAAGRVEVGVQGASHSLPLARLARMTRDLRRALHGLRAQRRRARAHAAWNFSAPSGGRKPLEAEHRRILLKLRTRAASELARFSEILDALAAKAGKAGKSRANPRKFTGDSQQGIFF